MLEGKDGRLGAVDGPSIQEPGSERIAIVAGPWAGRDPHRDIELAGGRDTKGGSRDGAVTSTHLWKTWFA